MAHHFQDTGCWIYLFVFIVIFRYDQQYCGIDKIVGTEAVRCYTWVGLSKIAVKIFNGGIKYFNTITPIDHNPKNLRPEEIPIPVTPVPHQVRDKLHRESIICLNHWIPASAGMTKTELLRLFTKLSLLDINKISINTIS
jgi:hypothetical protein